VIRQAPLRRLDAGRHPDEFDTRAVVNTLGGMTNGTAHRYPTFRDRPQRAWLSTPRMQEATFQAVPHVRGTDGLVSDVATAKEGRLGSDPSTLLRMLPFTSRFAPPALLPSLEQRLAEHGIRAGVVPFAVGGLTRIASRVDDGARWRRV
jgi:hypothetical protein